MWSERRPRSVDLESLRPFGLWFLLWQIYFNSLAGDSALYLFACPPIPISISVVSLSCFYFFIKFSSVKLIIHVLISSYRIYLFTVDLSALSLALSLPHDRCLASGFVSMSFNIYNLIFWGLSVVCVDISRVNNLIKTAFSVYFTISMSSSLFPSLHLSLSLFHLALCVGISRARNLHKFN